MSTSSNEASEVASDLLMDCFHLHLWRGTHGPACGPEVHEHAAVSHRDPVRAYPIAGVRRAPAALQVVLPAMKRAHQDRVVVEGRDVTDRVAGHAVAHQP